MLKFQARVVLSLLLALPLFAEDSPREKFPIPPASSLKDAEKLVKDLFSADYARTDVASRTALCEKLLIQSAENRKDPAALYVLLREAREQAFLAGDVEHAVSAQRAIAYSFKLDHGALITDLAKLESIAKTNETATVLVKAYELIWNDALTASDYDAAARAAIHAEDLLRFVKDQAYVAQIKVASTNVQALKRDSAAAAAAEKKLSANPSDPAANLTAGRFALMRGEFEKSFALLAKGSDTVLAGLAGHELAPPTDAAQQMLLADGWFDRSEKESGVLKAKMRVRAGVWYAQAIGGTQGLAKMKIEARLKTLGPAPETAKSVAAPQVAPQSKTRNKWTPLLSSINLERDTQAGNWELRNGVLSISEWNPTGVMRVRVPFEPPAEYDYKVLFEPTSDDKDTNIAFILAKNENQFSFQLGSSTRFQHIQNAQPLAGGFKFEKNHRYTALIQVRTTGAAAFVDERQVSACTTDYSELKAPSNADLKTSDLLQDSRTVGFGIHRGTVKVYSIEVLEVGGRGRLQREGFIEGPSRDTVEAPVVIPPVDPKSTVNIALASSGATITGDGKFPEVIIDGNIRTFADAHYPCEYVITLAKAYPISHIRMRLLDYDPARYYQYKIESSADGQRFTTISDQSNGKRRSWQIIDFPSRVAKAIRITGLKNSANPGFHIVEFEAYAVSPDDPPVPRFENE